MPQEGSDDAPMDANDHLGDNMDNYPDDGGREPSMASEVIV